MADEIEKEEFGRCTNCDYPFYHDCLPVHDAERTEDGGLKLLDHYLCQVCATKFMDNPEMVMRTKHSKIMTPDEARKFEEQVRKEWLDEQGE